MTVLNDDDDDDALSTLHRNLQSRRWIPWNSWKHPHAPHRNHSHDIVWQNHQSVDAASTRPVRYQFDCLACWRDCSWWLNRLLMTLVKMEGSLGVFYTKKWAVWATDLGGPNSSAAFYWRVWFWPSANESQLVSTGRMMHCQWLFNELNHKSLRFTFSS